MEEHEPAKVSEEAGVASGGQTGLITEQACGGEEKHSLKTNPPLRKNRNQKHLNNQPTNQHTHTHTHHFLCNQILDLELQATWLKADGRQRERYAGGDRQPLDRAIAVLRGGPLDYTTLDKCIAGVAEGNLALATDLVIGPCLARWRGRPGDRACILR